MWTQVTHVLYGFVAGLMVTAVFRKASERSWRSLFYKLKRRTDRVCDINDRYYKQLDQVSKDYNALIRHYAEQSWGRLFEETPWTVYYAAYNEDGSVDRFVLGDDEHQVSVPMREMSGEELLRAISEAGSKWQELYGNGPLT